MTIESFCYIKLLHFYLNTYALSDYTDFTVDPSDSYKDMVNHSKSVGSNDINMVQELLWCSLPCKPGPKVIELLHVQVI